MHQRFEPNEVIPSIMAGLARAARPVEGGVGPALTELLKVRVSQRNGCAYCCELHARKALEAGVEPAVLNALPGWAEIPSLDARTRAALTVADTLTTMEATPDPGPALDAAAATLGTETYAEVVGIVATIGAFNRVMRAAGRPPEAPAS